jgi:hypothetical protein
MHVCVCMCVYKYIHAILAYLLVLFVFFRLPLVGSEGGGGGGGSVYVAVSGSVFCVSMCTFVPVKQANHWTFLLAHSGVECKYMNTYGLSGRTCSRTQAMSASKATHTPLTPAAT